MHKLWISSSLALLVGILTLIMGVLSDIRLSAMLYRFLISFIVFGIGGYVLTSLVEKFISPDISTMYKGQKVDIVSEQEPVNETYTEESLFIPLTPDNLEHIPNPSNEQ